MPKNIADLKYAYFGGGADAEYQYFLRAAAAGRTAVDSLSNGVLALVEPSAGIGPFAISSAPTPIPGMVTAPFVVPPSGRFRVDHSPMLVGGLTTAGAIMTLQFRKNGGAWQDGSNVILDGFNALGSSFDPQSVLFPAAGKVGTWFSAGDTVEVRVAVSHPSTTSAELRYIEPSICPWLAVYGL